MRGLELIIDWRDPPPEGEAFGPERATWAGLVLRLDGQDLTANHPADRPSRDDADGVVGGMSGLAEWIVENWAYILWDLQPPFPRSPALPGATHTPFLPGLREALSGWPDHEALGGLREPVAVWQHRHTLGHASSDIAFPSVVLAPEERHVAVVIDHPPAQLDPSVRFTPPSSPGGWPSGATWIAKEDVEESLHGFVSATLARAQDEADGQQWASWLSRSWEETRRRAQDESSRRKLMFGPLVAQEWADLAARMADREAAIVGLLLDMPLLTAPADLEILVEVVSASSANGSVGSLARGQATGVCAGSGRLPWQQGYAAAEVLRRRLGLADDPIPELRQVLDELGIGLRQVESRGRFRSAVVRDPADRATICVATDDRRHAGVNPFRFGVVAGLGRLVCEGIGPATASFGAAQGPYARYREAQRANAFAAEFLLPERAATSDVSLDRLCEEYGISRSAAQWHRENRMRTTV